MLIDNGGITLTFSNVSLAWPKSMQTSQGRQEAVDQSRGSVKPWNAQPAPRERIVPNPKLKLLDQVREIMRRRHYGPPLPWHRREDLALKTPKRNDQPNSAHVIQKPELGV